MSTRKLDNCLVCSSGNLELILDLGNQPSANALKDYPRQTEETFPLALNLCKDCFHLQLTHVVDPKILYKDYPYLTGTSRTMREHCQWFAGFVEEYYNSINSRMVQDDVKKVLDIGANDGTQLDYFKGRYKTYGVEPATNLYEISRKKHIVLNEFFTEKSFASETFEVITAQNVFAHNPDPLGFLENVKKLMNLSSLLFIQVSQADMIKNNEWDTLYGEHLSFYSINSMKTLLDFARLHLLDVVKCPIHGNSYIFIISKYHQKYYNVQNLLAMEKVAGLHKVETYREYAKKCKIQMKKLRETIEYYNRSDIGMVAVGYGAAAKGMTVINSTGIKLDAIIDDNPLKQGKYAPGSDIPIVHPDVLKYTCYEDNVLFVPLAWNFFDEISEKIISKRQKPHDLFLRYFPDVTVTKAKDLV